MLRADEVETIQKVIGHLDIVSSFYRDYGALSDSDDAMRETGPRVAKELGLLQIKLQQIVERCR